VPGIVSPASRRSPPAVALPSLAVTPHPTGDGARPEPVEGELYGPAEVGPMLGVKPQVVVNWVRDDRIHASAVDELGRNRFTAEDVRRIRASLGRQVGA
jgi:hypothetical protein